MKFKNGDVLVGEWKGYDFKNGNGVLSMTYAQGETVQGLWINGCFQREVIDSISEPQYLQ